MTELEAELERVSVENSTLQEEVSSVRELLEIETAKVESEKVKYKEFWRMSCEQLASHDELMASKEKEVEELKMRRSELEPGSHSAVHACTTQRVETLEPPKPGRTATPLRADATEFVSPAVSGMSVSTTAGAATSRRGKAPLSTRSAEKLASRIGCLRWSPLQRGMHGVVKKLYFN